MKRSLVLVGFCTFVVTLVWPAESRAGIGWLEKLSGPGPFVGIVVPVPIRCDPLDGSKLKKDEGTWFGCPFGKEAPTRIVGVEVWRLWTDHNELPYGTSVDKGVRIFAAIGTLEYAPWKQLKVGGGLGVAWVSGDAFETFARPLAQPVRLTLAPLSLLAPDRNGLDALKVHMNSNVFLGGVDASDFGALGNFEAPYELQWELSLEYDFWSLFHK